MAFNRKDGYYQQAKQAGLRSRAAYKLEQLQRRYRLGRRGDRILELGAAPGGWMQVNARRVGPRGLVLGIDLLPIAALPTPPCHTIQADIFAPELPALIAAVHPGRFNGVISDIAPNLSGVKAADQARAAELNYRVLELADSYLRPGGFFLCKVFQHGELPAFQRQVRERFRQVVLTKPEASRRSSAELYLLGAGYRGQK